MGWWCEKREDGEEREREGRDREEAVHAGGAPGTVEVGRRFEGLKEQAGSRGFPHLFLFPLQPACSFLFFYVMPWKKARFHHCHHDG